MCEVQTGGVQFPDGSTDNAIGKPSEAIESIAKAISELAKADHRRD